MNLLLMVEKCLRGRIYHSVYKYANAYNKYIKDYDKNKKSSYLQYWHVENLYGCAMSQKLPVNNMSGLKILFNSMKIS